MHEHKDEDYPIKDFGSLDFEIVSSTDHPFAIVDALKKYLRETRESLDISAPWYSKSFVDFIRTFVPRFDRASKRIITRTPTEGDIRTFKSVESFAALENSSVKCKPYLHPKFIIIDKRIVISGSVNPTSSGMYDNDEILYVSKKPFHVKRHQEIFNKLWYDPRNTSWEDVQQYFGFEGRAIGKNIAEEILGIFSRNSNYEVEENGLVKRVTRRLGVNERQVIRVIECLVLDGVLWRPKDNTLKRV
jgi:hypothetical protein